MYAYMIDQAGCTIQGDFTAKELEKFQLAHWEILADASNEEDFLHKISVLKEFN